MRSLDTGELRGQNRADGARVGGAVGVTAGALVHGAHVHAGGATDATQSLAANLVGQNGGTTVVDEDDVHVLRAVTGGDAGPHGGVGVHALTGGGTGQQLQEGLVVLEGGQNLLDTHEGNQGVGQGEAHTAVTLGLHDGQGTGLGDAEVSAGDCHGGVQELVAQAVTGCLCQFCRLIGDVRVDTLNLAQEDVANLAAVTVNCGHQNVGGAVVAELHDFLGEVGLDSVDAVFLEELVQTGLCGCHGFDLDDFVHALLADQVQGDLVCLGGVAGPVHVATGSGEVALELLEQLGEVCQNVVLDALTGVTQVLPVGQLCGDAGALVTNRVGHEAQVGAQLLVLELFLGVLGEGDFFENVALAVMNDLGHTKLNSGHEVLSFLRRLRARCSSSQS